MKTLIAFWFFLVFALTNAFTQNLQGKAVYKTKKQFNVQFDSTQVNDEMMKKMRERLKSHFERDYTLKFSNVHSLYTENEKLEKPSVDNGAIKVEVSASRDELFKNVVEGTYTRQQDLMGKMFLIKDSLQTPDWKLEKETKMIGKYTCFKATRSREVTRREFRSGEEEATESKKEVTTTVWYTPEIPVQHGPGDYWGLPGLILEVQEDDLNILCSEIILNPAEDLKIQQPAKGKVVSQEEFIRIREEKNKEMMERYGNGRNGNVIMIRTGS